MMNKEHPQKGIVWITLFLIAVLIIGVGISARGHEKAPVEIDTVGQPTLGNPNAPIHIVVFKEPKCTSCASFSKDIYPKLKKDFIDTGKVKFTILMTSFLPDSMPAACAMLCVYDDKPENTELYYEYMEYIYLNQPSEDLDWAKPALLCECAQKVSNSIDLKKLNSCITHKRYCEAIEKNTEQGNEIMDGSIRTPKTYVNGVEMKSMNYEMLSDYLKDLLKKENENV